MIQFLSAPETRRFSGLLCLFLAACCCASPTSGGEQSHETFTAEQRNFWAFQPVRKAAPPSMHSAQMENGVDAFLLERLQEKGLAFSPPAVRLQLLRRAKFDLHGLPPTPEEIQAFQSDHAPGAYDRLLDRLLASPRYGEKWGRYWLDLVRFSETAGFNADTLRPLAYKYRDYAIQAFNHDTPYDRFVQEQIAGDELFPESEQALVATGYNLMWPDESNASDVLLARQDALNDLTGNVASVFLGLTLGCAQCHDHKFDPLLQEDFYRLQAFFSGITPRQAAPLGSTAQLRSYEAALQTWLAETKEVRLELHILERDAKAKSGRIKRLKFPAVVLAAVDTMPEQRTAYQLQLAFWAERQIEVSEKQLTDQMTPAQQARRQELQAALKHLETTKPQPPRTVAVMASLETATGPAATYLLGGGGYDNALEELQPGFVSILARGQEPKITAPRAGASGRRTALARWLTNPENALAGRVMVNRIWQGHFGKGLVENGNDFGIRTPQPEHLPLLDWLTTEFVRQGWSIKQMHRLLMTSAAYRQSTYRPTMGQTPSKSFSADPGNTLYWSFPRRRLMAESIRDAMLQVSGELDFTMFGPGVRPNLPPNFSSRHGWKPSERASARNRRSVYIHAKRNLPYPLLQVFDLPDMHESCAKRAETTVAPQSLMVLNSDLILDYAQAFSNRLTKQHTAEEQAGLIASAYEMAFGRRPHAAELSAAETFLQTLAAVSGDPAQEQPDAQGWTKSQRDAVADFCHVLFNTNEFIYLD